MKIKKSVKVETKGIKDKRVNCVNTKSKEKTQDEKERKANKRILNKTGKVNWSQRN